MARDKRKPGKLRYKVSMIRDFLQHLDWEVRIHHAELMRLGGKTIPELVEALMQYARKYHCAGLLMANQLDPDPSGQVPEAEAEPILRRYLQQRAERWLRAWNDLHDLFEEATSCAEIGDKFVIRPWNAKAVKEKLGGQAGSEDR